LLTATSGIVAQAGYVSWRLVQGISAVRRRRLVMPVC
jgi:hypothetical protein